MASLKIFARSRGVPRGKTSDEPIALKERHSDSSLIFFFGPGEAFDFRQVPKAWVLGSLRSFEDRVEIHHAFFQPFALRRSTEVGIVWLHPARHAQPLRSVQAVGLNRSYRAGKSEKNPVATGFCSSRQ